MTVFLTKMITFMVAWRMILNWDNMKNDRLCNDGDEEFWDDEDNYLWEDEDDDTFWADDDDD